MSEPEDDAPDNPFGDSVVGMISLHELFSNMMNAGFTEKQACVIVGTMLAHVNGEDDGA